MTKTKNISNKAYIHIRETLLNSGVYVGQKILHQELGQKLGISHTPLREALFRLAAEGLLTHENYKALVQKAVESGVITEEQATTVRLAQEAARAVIGVDEFTRAEIEGFDEPAFRPAANSFRARTWEPVRQTPGKENS